MAGHGQKHKFDLPGLKVEHSSKVLKEDLPSDVPAGWYVFVKKRQMRKLRNVDRSFDMFEMGENHFSWEAVLPLRFSRCKDAMIAMTSLVAAQLDSKKRMIDAGGMEVLRVAFENLQW